MSYNEVMLDNVQTSNQITKTAAACRNAAAIVSTPKHCELTSGHDTKTYIDNARVLAFVYLQLCTLYKSNNPFIWSVALQATTPTDWNGRQGLRHCRYVLLVLALAIEYC